MAEKRKDAKVKTCPITKKRLQIKKRYFRNGSYFYNKASWKKFDEAEQARKEEEAKAAAEAAAQAEAEAAEKAAQEAETPVEEAPAEAEALTEEAPAEESSEEKTEA